MCIRDRVKNATKTRIVDLKHDLPAEWEKVIDRGKCCSLSNGKNKQEAIPNRPEKGATICLCLDRERFFPWHRKSTPARVSQVDLVVQSSNGDVEFEKIDYWVGGEQHSSAAHLIENCLIENTYKAELNPGDTHKLTTWKAQLPADLNPEAIYFLVHYYYEQDQGACCGNQNIKSLTNECC